MLIENYIKLPLNHSAHFLKSALGGGHFVAASDDGMLTTVNNQLKRVTEFKIDSKITGIAIHPFKELIAVASGDNASLQFFNFEGFLVAEFLDRESSYCIDCDFHFDGEKILCISRHAADEITLQLIEAQTSAVKSSITLLDSLNLEDPFIDSCCTLDFNSDSKTLALILAGGQDGQQGYWLSIAPKLSAHLEPRLANTTHPVFSPNGDLFLVLEAQERIVKYRFPDIQELGSYVMDDGDDDSIGIDCCFVDSSNFLIRSERGRLFLIDIEEMTILEEVVIADHEPKEGRFYYPRLSKFTSISTDIDRFTKLGDKIVMMYQNQQKDSVKERKDTLICLPISNFHQ